MIRSISILMVLTPVSVFCQNIYVNGIDVSSAINQHLEKVDIHIDERGDVFITAPNYEVHEEVSYRPLNKAPADSATLLHQTAKELPPVPKEAKIDVKTPEQPRPTTAPVAVPTAPATEPIASQPSTPAAQAASKPESPAP